MTHTRAMNFEWDDAKSESCFRERGFDSAYAARAFFDRNRLVRTDNRRCSGEDRYQCFNTACSSRFTRLVKTPFVLSRPGKPINARLNTMKTVHVTIEADSDIGRIDPARVDATTEADIARHIAQDETNSMLDSARFARRVSKHRGLSQAEFSQRIDVSLETVRNWEQGKRSPTGAAKALLKVLDKAPEAALATLD